MKTKDALTLLAVLGAGYLAWKTWGGISSAASAAGQAAATYLNPASQQNVAYSAVNDVGAVVTGQPVGSFSLGASIWDWLHPSQVAAETAATTGTVSAAVSVSPTAPSTGDTSAMSTDQTAQSAQSYNVNLF